VLHAPDRTRLLSVTALPPVRPGHVVVEVVGEVDAYTAPLLDACLATQTRRHGVATLTVDMRRVTFLGAAGVSVLAQAQRRCRMRGTRLAVVPDSRGRVVHPLRLCGLDGVFRPGPAEAGPAASRAVRAGAPSRAGARRSARRSRRQVCR
jgi:anti-sigma B factor antagonist